MDDLKIRIWDYLYRAGEGQRIEIIAQQMNEALEAIQQAVNDPWFDQNDGTVAIAQAEHKW